MAKSSNKSGPVTIITPAQVAQAVQAGVQGAALAAGNTPAKAPVVALRGGPAVALVQVVAGATYRTKAPHNVAWWATVQAQATAAPVAVATLCAAPYSVPSHFVGYCLRRGYLAALPVAPQAPVAA